VVTGSRKIVNNGADIRRPRSDYLYGKHRYSYSSTGLAFGAAPIAWSHAGTVVGVRKIVLPAAAIDVKLVVSGARGGGAVLNIN